LFSLAWGGEPCRDEANVVAAIHVYDDDDPSQDIESDRGESWLVRVRIIDRDRVRIAEYPFGVREANPVLPEIRPGLGRIPRRCHVCIMCICRRSVKI
jgi:hypothetical protein